MIRPIRPHALRPRRNPVALIALGIGLLLPLACSSDEPTSSSTADTRQTAATDAAAGGGQLDVVASFYPLQFVAELVGGARVSVTNMTPAGAEPHDLELSADDTAGLQDAALVIYLAGFSPALDDGIATVAADHALDVTDSARLDLGASADEHGDEENSGEDATGEDEHGGADPHFWLDPTRLADVADAVAERLSTLDPEGAATYAQNAGTLRGRLEELDGELLAGLSECATTELVTSHTAFAYLADRYGLEQVGIAGVSPESEPSSADLAEITEYVRDHGVTTIYTETLIDPAVAETVADETGAATAVLDPLEGLSDASQGSDYLEVMRSNLSTLRSGQGCS